MRLFPVLFTKECDYIENEVLDFIKRRFSIDCNWKSGNCYQFSIILHDRFKNSSVFYDVIDGHFCVKIGDNYYDWEGIYSPTVPIEWDKFDEYDSLLKQRIIRDCIN